MLGPWQSQLCDIQGRLFENAGKAGYNSEQFIKQFMTSSLAKELDSTYNRMQWAGEEYLLEEFADRCPAAPKDGNLYDNEVLYWAGYVYRYWHFLTGESSKDIYKQAPDVPLHGYGVGDRRPERNSSAESKEKVEKW